MDGGDGGVASSASDAGSEHELPIRVSSPRLKELVRCGVPDEYR